MEKEKLHITLDASAIERIQKQALKISKSSSLKIDKTSMARALIFKGLEHFEK